MYIAQRDSYDGLLYGTHGEVMCRLWMSKAPIWSLLVSSLFNLEVITIEKYFAIVHPHKRRLAQLKNSTVAIVLLTTWLFGACYTLPYTGLTSAVIDGHCHDNNVFPNTTASRIFGLINFSIKYLIPISLFAFCYTNMLFALRHKKPTTVFTVATGDASREHIFVKAKYNIFKTMLCIVIAHMCCWSSEKIVKFIIYFGDPQLVPTSVRTAAEILVYANCCVNPIILLTSYSEFRRTVRFNFRRLLRMPVSEIAPVQRQSMVHVVAHSVMPEKSQ